MKLTPHLVVNGASDASAYYVKAFGATEVMRMPAEDGKRLMHCELNIAGNKMFLCDNFPEYCGGKNRDPKTLGDTPVTLHFEVENCDAAMKKAADAGGTVIMPAQDMFWGDRYGQ